MRALGRYVTNGTRTRLKNRSCKMATDGFADRSDEALLLLAGDGKKEAFDSLVERYKHEAYRIAFDFTRQREEAKDLSQEAFLRVYTRLHQFNHQASFHTWFYRILVNLCLDYRRRNHRVLWESLEERSETDGGKSVAHSEGPEFHAITNEMTRELEATLNALPPKQREAYVLNKREGLSIRQVAHRTKTAEGAVRVNIHRAVTALRKSMGKLTSEDAK